MFPDVDAKLADAWSKRKALPFAPDRAVYARGPVLGKTRLRLESRKRLSTALTKPDWLLRHGVSTPPTAPAPAWVPTSLHGNAFREYHRDGASRMAFYGSEARYVLRFAEDGIMASVEPLLDFGKWQRAGRFIPLVDAKISGSQLFVETAINGYAREVGGKTGYLSALDETGKLLWHAGPRVANAWSFAVVKDVIVCGYGFTRESDALFVLDRATGRTLQNLPLSSAAEWIVEYRGKVFVRCYDAEYVFQIRSV